MKPKRDWEIIIAVFIALAVIVLVGNIYFLYLLTEGKIFNTITQLGDETIFTQKKAVQAVNKIFDEKAIALENFQDEPPLLADPSL